MEEKAIPFLRIRDASVSAAWYRRLGFEQVGEVHRFGPGMPAFMAVKRGPMELFLSEHVGDAPRNGLVYLAVADVRPIAGEFNVKIEEAPWGFDIEVRDPDGNRIRLGMPK